jgi:hypothetical protein
VTGVEGVVDVVVSLELFCSGCEPQSGVSGVVDVDVRSLRLSQCRHGARPESADSGHRDVQAVVSWRAIEMATCSRERQRRGIALL